MGRERNKGVKIEMVDHHQWKPPPDNKFKVNWDVAIDKINWRNGLESYFEES